MSSTKRILSTLADILTGMLSKGASKWPDHPKRPNAVLRPDGRSGTPPRADHGESRETDPGRMAGFETVQVDPERIHDVAVRYAPSRNSRPDSGEVIWTWVPYEENDGRGKDRPVLVIGRHAADRVYAVRMTSKPHDGDRDYLSIGSGAWDSQGRESWVDIEQLYSVHDEGMRREAAVLDQQRYGSIAQALITRYGWARG
ncbi:RNA 3'-terminal phosphate cyclase [Microbacterium esteraromaticum]|uniref:RNA 3'-terminal phosphate cyclase n=1 Tax=Microbacterium esteraromaticum TaxID=57043 RepID=A0A1R4ITF3_9MICO|nr:type II toxin-antitoxin system PemK/MazF family toxin [Microbacterium esteraromaticum]SJN23132.1 RNA 3'-terminal phosphate cyclase [Microbacterium esteraromaticum]